MSNRQSRPGSIPIPRSVPNPGSSRNIETVISISPLTSPSSRPTSSVRQIPEPRRVGLGGESSRFGASGSVDVSVSPTRSTARSASMAPNMPGRRRTPSRTSFEPRVIRSIEGEAMPVLDYDFIPAPSTSPTQGRRVSGPSVRTSGLHKPVVPQHVVAPVAFPRPAYLEFSALRHLLQPDGPVPPIAPRTKGQSSVSNTRPQPVSTPHSDDDDDDSVATNSPPPKRSRPGLISASPDQIFKLPSRWGDQDRRPHLNVSADGRELSYSGLFSSMLGYCGIELLHRKYLYKRRQRRCRRSYNRTNTACMRHLLLRSRDSGQRSKIVSFIIALRTTKAYPIETTDISV